MNPTMGQYIDRLTDEKRDRLVGALGFSDGGWFDGECGCLVYTAEAPAMVAGHEHAAERAVTEMFGSAHCLAAWDSKRPEFRYPRAVSRFGKARVVRAIKLRASSAMSSEVERVADAQEVGA